MEFMKTKKLFMLIIAISFFVSCKDKNPGNSNDDIIELKTDETITLTKEQIINSDIELGYISNKIFYDHYFSNGKITIIPQSQLTISFPYTVRIEKIFVNDGDLVNTNQALFSIGGIEIIKLQQDFSNVYFKFLTLKTEYERQKDLLKENIISQKEYNQLENEYLAYSLQYESYKLLLNNIGIDYKKVQNGKIFDEITIFSKFSGYVKLHKLSLGMIVNPNEAIIDIFNLSDLILAIEMFEKNVVNTKVGDTVIFYRLNDKENQYKAIITQKGKIVNNETHTVIDYAKPLTKNIDKLLINSFVQVDILNNKRTILAVPEEAVQFQDKNYFIFVLKEITKDSSYVFTKKKIKIGETQNNYIQIFDTIKSKIILKGSSTL